MTLTTSNHMSKDITTYHTKQLLKMLRAARANQRIRELYGDEDFYGVNFTVEELKAELAKRPHVPNKKEARKIRQERAKK